MVGHYEIGVRENETMNVISDRNEVIPSVLQLLRRRSPDILANMGVAGDMEPVGVYKHLVMDPTRRARLHEILGSLINDGDLVIGDEGGPCGAGIDIVDRHAEILNDLADNELRTGFFPLIGCEGEQIGAVFSLRFDLYKELKRIYREKDGENMLQRILAAVVPGGGAVKDAFSTEDRYGIGAKFGKIVECLHRHKVNNDLRIQILEFFGREFFKQETKMNSRAVECLIASVSGAYKTDPRKFAMLNADGSGECKKAASSGDSEIDTAILDFVVDALACKDTTIRRMIVDVLGMADCSGLFLVPPADSDTDDRQLDVQDIEQICTLWLGRRSLRYTNPTRSDAAMLMEEQSDTGLLSALCDFVGTMYGGEDKRVTIKITMILAKILAVTCVLNDGYVRKETMSVRRTSSNIEFVREILAGATTAPDLAVLVTDDKAKRGLEYIVNCGGRNETIKDRLILMLNTAGGNLAVLGSIEGEKRFKEIVNAKLPDVISPIRTVARMLAEEKPIKDILEEENTAWRITQVSDIQEIMR